MKHLEWRIHHHRLREILAWSVHLYTGLGLVASALMAVLIVQADSASVRWVFALMLVAMLIDATDGTLARAFRVKEVLPGFDGRRLDDLIDFLTYTVLPLFLIWKTGILPDGQEAWLLVPLLASAYGFCQVSAKTADGYFLGFPSFWNLVAFYLYMLHFHVMPLPGWLSIGLLLGFALLTFLPTRYLYTSQRGPLSRLTNVLAVFWTILLMLILYHWPSVDGAETSSISIRSLLLASLVFPAYYLAASWTVSWLLWREESAEQPEPQIPTIGGLIDDCAGTGLQEL